MADETSTPPAVRKKTLADLLPWYYITRGVGAAILIFGVFADHTPERGTIILTGAGLMGVDKVARSEPPAPSKEQNNDTER